MATRRAGLSLRRALQVGALACLTACIQDDGQRFNPWREMTEVSLDDEREIGLEFDREIRKHVQIVEDPVVAGFINDLGQSIVRQLEPQPFIYRFRVVLDPSLNAFAVPGGYVYFHSGTVLAAGSIDELAGVMGHEIAHVRGRHYARMRAKTQIPDIVVGVAGMAAAVATGEGGLLVAAQAANVAAKLSFSREFENEADRYGSIFMTRAGYQPAEITRFFERILDEQEQLPDSIPPYLFSHPDVEDRIATVNHDAGQLRVSATPNPRFAEELADVQARLAYLVEERRDTVPPPTPPEDPTRIDPLLARAEQLAQAGRVEESLSTLSRAEAIEPNDPRAPYRRGELLAEQGQLEAAVAAYRRTLRLDPTRAQVFYRLGLAHRLLGERHSAVQAFEQASRRSGSSSALSQRADWHVETLIFPVLVESGFADGARDGATPLGEPQQSAAAGTSQLTWYGRVDDRYEDHMEHLAVVWRDPAGQILADAPVELGRGGWISSTLPLAVGAPAGAWSAVLTYQGDPLERDTLELQASR